MMLSPLTDRRGSALRDKKCRRQTLTESGQLDLVEVLYGYLNSIEGGLTDFEDTLNPQIDANPDDKLLMEMLDVVSDARESITEARDLLQTMEKRDREEIQAS
jgi:hypothetical protein